MSGAAPIGVEAEDLRNRDVSQNMGQLLPQIAVIIQENNDLRSRLKKFSNFDDLHLELSYTKQERDRLDTRCKELETKNAHLESLLAEFDSNFGGVDVLVKECRNHLQAKKVPQNDYSTIPKLTNRIKDELKRLSDLEALLNGRDVQSLLDDLKKKDAYIAQLEAELEHLRKQFEALEGLNKRVAELNNKNSLTYTLAEEDPVIRMLEQTNQIEFQIKGRDLVTTKNPEKAGTVVMLFSKKHATHDDPFPTFQLISQTEWARFSKNTNFTTSIVAPYNFDELKISVYGVESDDIREEDLLGSVVLPNYLLDRWKLSEERSFALAGGQDALNKLVKAANSRLSLQLVYSSKFDRNSAGSSDGASAAEALTPLEVKYNAMSALQAEVGRMGRIADKADTQTVLFRKKIRELAEANRHLASTNSLLVIELRKARDQLGDAERDKKKLAELEAELNSLRSQLADLQALIERLRAEKAALEKDKAMLDAQVSALKQQVQSQAERLEELDAENARLATKAAKVDRLEREKSEMQTQIETMEATIKGLQLTQTTLQDKVRSVMSTCSALEQEKDELADELHQAKKSLKNAQQAAQDAISAKNHIEKMYNETQERLKESEAGRMTAESQVKERDAEIARLLAQLRDLQLQLEAVQDALRTALQEKASLMQQLNNLKRLTDGLGDDPLAEKDRLTKENQELKDLISRLEQQLRELNRDYQATKADRDHIYAEKLKLKQTRDLFEKSFGSLREENEETKTALQEAWKRVEHLQGQLARMADLDDLLAQLAKLKGELARLKAELDEKNLALAQNDGLRSELENLRAIIEKQAARIRDLDTFNETLNAALRHALKENREQAVTIEEMVVKNATLPTLQKTVDDRDRSIHELNEKLNHAGHELQTVKSEIAKLRDDNDKQMHALDEKQRQLNETQKQLNEAKRVQAQPHAVAAAAATPAPVSSSVPASQPPSKANAPSSVVPPLSSHVDPSKYVETISRLEVALAQSQHQLDTLRALLYEKERQEDEQKVKRGAEGSNDTLQHINKTLDTYRQQDDFEAKQRKEQKKREKAAEKERKKFERETRVAQKRREREEKETALMRETVEAKQRALSESERAEKEREIAEQEKQNAFRERERADQEERLRLENEERHRKRFDDLSRTFEDRLRREKEQFDQQYTEMSLRIERYRAESDRNAAEGDRLRQTITQLQAEIQRNSAALAVDKHAGSISARSRPVSARKPAASARGPAQAENKGPQVNAIDEDDEFGGGKVLSQQQEPEQAGFSESELKEAAGFKGVYQDGVIVDVDFLEVVQKREAAWRAEINARDENIVKLEDKIEALQVSEKGMIRTLRRAEDSHSAELRRIREQLLAEYQKHREQLLQEQEQHLHDAKRLHVISLNKVKDTFDSKLASYTARIEEQEQRIKELQEEYSKNEQILQKQVADVQQELEEENQQLRKAHEAIVKKLKGDHEETRLAYENTISEIRVEHEKQVHGLKTFHDQSVAQAREQHHNVVSGYKQQVMVLKQALTQLDESTMTMVESLRVAVEKKLDKMRARVERITIANQGLDQPIDARMANSISAEYKERLKGVVFTPAHGQAARAAFKLMQGLRKERVALMAALTSSQQNLRAARKELAEYKDNADHASAEVMMAESGLKSKISQLEQENGALKTQLDGHRDMIAILHRTKFEHSDDNPLVLNARLLERDTEIKELNQRVTLLHVALKNAEAGAEQMRRTNDMRRSDVRIMESKLEEIETALQQERTAHQETVRAMQQGLKDKDRSVQDALNKLTQQYQARVNDAENLSARLSAPDQPELALSASDSWETQVQKLMEEISRQKLIRNQEVLAAEARLDQEIQKARREGEEAVAKARQEDQERMEEMRRLMESDRERLVKKYQEMVAMSEREGQETAESMEARYKSQITNLESSYENKMKLLDTGNADKLYTLEMSYKQKVFELQKIVTEQNEKIFKMEAEYKQMTADLEVRHRSFVAELEAKDSAHFERETNSIRQQMATMEQHYKKKIENMEEEHTQQMSTMTADSKSNANKAITELKDSANKKFAELHASHEQTLAALKQLHEQQQLQLQEEVNARQSALVFQQENKIKRLTEKFQSKIKELIERHATAVRLIGEAHEKQVSALNEEIERLRESHTTSVRDHKENQEKTVQYLLNEAKSKAAETRAAHQKQVETMRIQHEVEIKNLMSNLKGSEEKWGELQSRYSRQIEELSHNNNRLSETAENQIRQLTDLQRSLEIEEKARAQAEIDTKRMTFEMSNLQQHLALLESTQATLKKAKEWADSLLEEREKSMQKMTERVIQQQTALDNMELQKNRKESTLNNRVKALEEEIKSLQSLLYGISREEAVLPTIPETTEAPATTAPASEQSKQQAAPAPVDPVEDITFTTPTIMDPEVAALSSNIAIRTETAGLAAVGPNQRASLASVLERGKDDDKDLAISDEALSLLKSLEEEEAKEQKAAERGSAPGTMLTTTSAARINALVSSRGVSQEGSPRASARAEKSARQAPQ